MDILDELELIANAIGGGSDAFKRVDALVNNILSERDSLRTELQKEKSRTSEVLFFCSSDTRLHFFNKWSEEYQAPVPAMPMQVHGDADSACNAYAETLGGYESDDWHDAPVDGVFKAGFAAGQLAVPIPKQESAGAVPDGLKELIESCRQIGFPVVSDGMKSVIDDMQTALRRVQNSICRSSPSITEQDAQEIATSHFNWRYEAGFSVAGSFDSWLESEGRALLNKLNEKNNE